uniref:Uncharacterized protein n=1 Tax=Arundo donax TaxID=35708 RepID=A0A0A9ARH7_ARUDO
MIKPEIVEQKEHWEIRIRKGHQGIAMATNHVPRHHNCKTLHFTIDMCL